MNNDVCILKSVADFAPGAFENTAVEDGSIQLGRSGGAYLDNGCYTSPGFHFGPFVRLVPSWNADTPPGTTVEVQARIASGRRWSKWFSFGRWSPFIDRASAPPEGDEVARCAAEYLEPTEEHAPADTAQIRIYLHSTDTARTPKVHLLGLAAQKPNPPVQEALPVHKMLEIPAYSCLVRDPKIAPRIMSSTGLTMLMNRWGEDALPEEVARSMYDSESGRYGNIAFLTAAAGCFGYECYALYEGLNYLRREVRKGYAIGAQIHYRAPDLAPPAQGSQPKPRPENLPELEGAVADSVGHIVAVRGFVRQDNDEYVVLNDPLTPTNKDVTRVLPVKKFEELYTGLCLVLHKGPKYGGDAQPERLLAELAVEGSEVRLTAKGEALVPGLFGPEKLAQATVCYTLSDKIAWASAAQKRFYYLALDENGMLRFDRQAAAGRRITFYLTDGAGHTWVAERQMEPPQETTGEP